MAVVANYYTELIQTYSGKLLISIGDCLSFSFHSLSLLILMATNKRFYREMKYLCRKSNPADNRGEFIKLPNGGVNNNKNNNNNSNINNIENINNNIDCISTQEVTVI